MMERRLGSARFPPVRVLLAASLTVPVVLVDLFVRVDLDRGSGLDGRNLSLQLGAHHQVVVLVDAFELLLDGQTLVSRLENHLSLPGKHAACKETPSLPSSGRITSIFFLLS